MCTRVSCGIEFNHVHELRNTLIEAQKSSFDFLCVSLVHPRFRREHLEGSSLTRPHAFTRSDLLLNSSEWNSLIVGRITPDVCLNVDSNVKSIRINNEHSFNQEVLFACHLGIPAILLSVTSNNCINLARLMHNKVVNGSCGMVWAQVPLQASADNANNFRSDIAKVNETDTWHWWNRFHSIANLEKRIGLALEITADIPNADVLERWFGEPVKCAFIPTSIWLTNRNGFPVLSKAHQNLVRSLFKLHTQFVICGPQRHAEIRLYQQYLDHIVKTKMNTDSVDEFTRGYEDYLQCPLQPLHDNLESHTYEIFEKDPIKYAEYEKAIYQALSDKIKEFREPDKEIVIMVVGAGRGPLVNRTLKAAKEAGVNVKIYAVEKNPNAVVTLQAQQDEVWGEQVTVVSSDMRTWKAPEKADIIVSELLGSFGDNELSPECLDGAQKFLKDDGISIPCKYTSFLCPLQSPKLYTEIRQSREKDKHYLAHFETPYVVYLHNKLELAPSQPLFTFVHPNKDELIDNTRYDCLQFKITQDSVVHALSGYFETTLYKTITLSINPETHSPGMLSWFPILFPLKDPIAVQAGEIFEVHFWRCTNAKNVWYEWCVTSPVISPVHNPNGRSYTIGL